MNNMDVTPTADEKLEGTVIPTASSANIDPWITGAEVERITSDSRATRNRRMVDPESGFPKGVKLSPRKRVWRLSSILEWMEAQERKAANDPVYREDV